MHISRRLARAVSFAALALTTMPATAATLAQNTANSQATGTTAYWGQSFTVSVGADPANQTYNAVTFNFFNGGAAAAAGNFYLFTQAYVGSASSLAANAASAAGYVGTGAAAGGSFVFAPSLALTNNTQYFGYSDTSFVASGAGGNPYAGGLEYTSNSGGTANFNGFASFDLAFSVAGTPVSAVAGVPEPASWALMIGGFGLAGAAMRRRRRVALPA